MVALDAEFLFRLELRITGVDTFGVTPRGPRIISYVKGEFDGPGLKGSVDNGADFILLRRDMVAELNARMTLKTDAGELIYLHYTGFTDIPLEGKAAAALGQLPPGKFNPRVAVRLETGAECLALLNRVQAVGIGRADTVAGTVSYKIYAL